MDLQQTECDVLVVGGGAAGLAAAVAAARAGARTILVERHGALGGMATASLVHSICGLYFIRNEPQAVFANPGLATELAGRITALGAAWGPVRMGRMDVLLIHPTAMALAGDAMIAQARQLSLSLHTEMFAVHCDPTASQVTAVEVVCRGQRWAIRPRTVVDATGDGLVAALAQAPFIQKEGLRLQRPAYIFMLQGVEDVALNPDGKVRLAALLAQAVGEKQLPEAALGTAFRSVGRPGEAFVTIDLPGGAGGAEYDPTDAHCLTGLELLGRSLAWAVTDFLRHHAPGFSHAVLAALPARVGVRESRRVEGVYTISGDDLIRGARFPDSVGWATWPMELRETARGPRWRFANDDWPCQIPLSALRARTLDNLFVAGRCISCQHEAQAALRVIGTCLVTGEAAGLAASLTAQGAAADAAAVRAAREQHILPVSLSWEERLATKLHHSPLQPPL